MRMVTSMALMFSGMCSTLPAMNPILPGTAFIPDGEPHVFDYKGEKRVFLYGSRDERITAYCGYGHDVWSAPVTNLTRWTNHGEVLNVRQIWDVGCGIVTNQHFGAPDCVYNPVTRKYYLYTFLGAGWKLDGREGPLPGSPRFVEGFRNPGLKCFMAASDSPAGPFSNPVFCDWLPANGAGTFDPSVLVDEQKDGSVRVYAYWGMKKGDRWAEIDPMDMHTVINGKTRKPDRNAVHKTLPEPDQFNGSTLFEASSIKKVGEGEYVFIYSPLERNSVLAYGYSNSPEGPWTYGGRIIDNQINWKGGNNHGSIANINGRWVVFYHRATSNVFNRQAMAEPIELRIEGDKVVIPSVEMTSQGVETNGLYAFRRFNANIACYRTNHAFIDGARRRADGLNPMVGIDMPNTVVGIKFLNFGVDRLTDADRLKLKLDIQMIRNTAVSVQVARPDEANEPLKRVDIASFNLQDHIKADGQYHEVVVPISGLDGNTPLKVIGGLRGQLAIFLCFRNTGGELCRFREIEFARGNASTPNP